MQTCKTGYAGCESSHHKVRRFDTGKNEPKPEQEYGSSDSVTQYNAAQGDSDIP